MYVTLKLTRASRCALATALCWMTAGCGEAPSEPAAAAPQTTAPAPLALASHEKATPTSPPVTPEIAPEAPANADVAPTPVADYLPPFPDRVDLFTAPKREGGARSHGDSEESVELLGFVEVDQPQAVLSINGQVTPIAAGGVQDGVEVISIQPPMVLLQRGRQRWQATLEN